MIKIGDKFWFKAHEIAVFLGYQNPEQAIRNLVPSEAQKGWDELKWCISASSDWNPNTVLISEGGLYRLLCRSTKQEAIKFEKWVSGDLLPTLRKTEKYTINQHLRFLTQQLKIKEQQLAAQQELIKKI